MQSMKIELPCRVRSLPAAQGHLAGIRTPPRAPDGTLAGEKRAKGTLLLAGKEGDGASRPGTFSK